MSDLMQVLCRYLQESRIQKYLASDLEYRENADRSDELWEKLSAQLDPSGKKLLHQYYDAVCLEHSCTEEALFQAALELCRELRGVL